MFFILRIKNSSLRQAMVLSAATTIDRVKFFVPYQVGIAKCDAHVSDME